MLELSTRYTIQRDARLPALDTSACRAYQALDMDGEASQGSPRPAVAFLYQPGNVLPLEQIRAFEAFDATGMVKFLDSGAAAREGDPGRDFAVVFEPPGEAVAPNLTDLFDPLSDEQIAVRFVRSVLPALRQIDARRTAHRAIRPTNLYYADGNRSQILLGPPMLSPPGQDQPAFLEPLESAMTDPRARALGTIADDMFSIGVTILMLATGKNPLKHETETAATAKRFEVTSYEVLAGGFRLSMSMTEVVRGLLADSPRERWGLRELGQWAVDGKRPTPHRVVPPKLASRPLKVGDYEVSTARSLAFAIAHTWDQAGKLLAGEEFQTWLRRGFSDEAVTERVIKVTRGSQETALRERSDRVVLNTLVVLDPLAPMRYRDVSFQMEGLTNLLAGALADGDEDTVADLSQMIANLMWSTWSIAQGTLSNEAARVRPLLERQQRVVTTRDPAQGIERVLYELSHAIPCLSPLVIEGCVVDLNDLLVALDRLPREALVEDFLTDRHILAFLAAHCKEITDTLLRQAVGRRSALQRLVHQIRMLAVVQASADIRVPNLTKNLADLLKLTAETEIKGSQLKELVLQDLDAAAPLGKIDALLKTLEGSGALEADRRGFEAARAEYLAGRKKLAELKDRLGQATLRSDGLGPQIAGMIGLASGLVAIAVMALMGVGF